jgi:hypothetical protein
MKIGGRQLFRNFLLLPISPYFRAKVNFPDLTVVTRICQRADVVEGRNFGVIVYRSFCRWGWRALSFAKTEANRFAVNCGTFRLASYSSGVSRGCALPIHGATSMHHHLRVVEGVEWALRFKCSEMAPLERQSYAARLS